MSTDDITFLQRFEITRYSVVASYVILIYDWLDWLEDEHRLVHQARWTPVKVLYLICRYYPLLYWPFFIWAWVMDHPLELCQRVIRPLSASSIPLRIVPQGVMLLRAYAFTGRRLSILCALCACYLTVVGIEIWGFGTDMEVLQQIYNMLGPAHSGCFRFDNGPIKTNIRLGIVTLSGFVMDSFSMSVVVIHCIRVRSTQGSLGRMFLQQGLAVFATTSVLNLLTSSVYFGQVTRVGGLGLPFLVTFSNTLACRLIILLRRKVTPTETFELKEHSRIVRRDVAAAETEPVDDWLN